MGEGMTREQVEAILGFATQTYRTSPDGSCIHRLEHACRDIKELVKTDAFQRAHLETVTQELAKHLSGDYSLDPADGIRNLAQAMISHRDNSVMLEQALATAGETIKALEEALGDCLHYMKAIHPKALSFDGLLGYGGKGGRFIDITKAQQALKEANQ